jgi:hypothetical protein
MKLALTGRRGSHAERWTMKQAKAMYARGVTLSATDVLQVWQTMDNGELLRYDSKRTRTLTDKIVEARKVQ